MLLKLLIKIIYSLFKIQLLFNGALVLRQAAQRISVHAAIHIYFNFY